LEHSSLQIEVAQIIIHKADQPDAVLYFLDGERLTGEDCAEVDLLTRFPETLMNRDKQNNRLLSRGLAFYFYVSRHA